MAAITLHNPTQTLQAGRSSRWKEVSLGSYTLATIVIIFLCFFSSMNYAGVSEVVLMTL